MTTDDQDREAKRVKFALHRKDGMSVSKACAEINITMATFHLWNRTEHSWETPGGWSEYDKDGGYGKRVPDPVPPPVRAAGYDKDGGYSKA